LTASTLTVGAAVDLAPRGGDTHCSAGSLGRACRGGRPKEPITPCRHLRVV